MVFSIVSIVLSVAAILLSFCTRHMSRETRRQAEEITRKLKEREDRKKSKLLDTQENIGRRIANVLHDRWAHRFNVVGFKVVDHDKTVFQVLVRRYLEDGNMETLLAVTVDAFATVFGEGGEIRLERSGMQTFHYSTREGSIKTAIEEASQFLG